MMQPFPSTDQFVHRHLGPTDADIQEMLATLGLQSLGALTDATVPEEIRMRKAVALDPSMGEHDALAKLRVLHDRNQVFRSFIGMGYSDCITPPVIQRNILEKQFHVAQRGDRYPDLSYLAHRHWVVGIITDLGGKVEGNR